MGQYDAGRQQGDWRWWAEDGKLINERTLDESEQLASEPDDGLETSQIEQLEQLR